MIRYTLLVVMLFSLSGCGFHQVDEGYRGIKKVWGKVVGDPLAPDILLFSTPYLLKSLR